MYRFLNKIFTFTPHPYSNTWFSIKLWYALSVNMSTDAETERSACLSYLSGVTIYAIEIVCTEAENDQLEGAMWDSRHVAGLKTMQGYIKSETEMCRLIDKIHGALALCKLYQPTDCSERFRATQGGVNLLKRVHMVVSELENGTDVSAETAFNWVRCSI